jgi:hypothetical protein
MEKINAPMPSMTTKTTPGSILILTDDTPPMIDGERDATRDLGGGFSSSRSPSPLPKPVDAETLQREMGNFITVVDQMFVQAERQKSGMQLDEIELAIEVTGEGQVILLGSGVKVAGKGAMTLRFKRFAPDTTAEAAHPSPNSPH